MSPLPDPPPGLIAAAPVVALLDVAAAHPEATRGTLTGCA
ncbi:hypothetical protein ABIA33_000130 [Streptacidiphilus sp. MAP12-16]